MFTFFLVVVVVYSLALFNNCEWEKENKKSWQNQHFDIPELVLWELEKLESQWTILFSQVWLCSHSALVASRLEQLHCKKWNNWRLFFLRRFWDYVKKQRKRKKSRRKTASASGAALCNAILFMLHEQRDHKYFCVWQWILLSHWMDAMMT